MISWGLVDVLEVNSIMWPSGYVGSTVKPVFLRPL